MINEYQAKRFCCESIKLIENYDKAITDTTQIWHCHHIWETMLGYSRQELKDMDEYYGIPACNLIFLTPSEHMNIHNKGNKHACGKRKPLSNKHKEKIRKSMIGRIITEETRKKISEIQKGRKLSEEHKRRIGDSKKGKINNKLSKKVIQYDLSGDFIKEWVSMAEIKRQLGFCIDGICRCCQGKRQTAYNYIWRYK